jgi:hypothetical protein
MVLRSTRWAQPDFVSLLILATCFLLPGTSAQGQKYLYNYSTVGLSALDSLGLSPFSIDSLIRQDGPLYCDHSVTSANVRLSVGREY